MITVVPVCHSDKQFVNSMPNNQHFRENRKRKVFKILEHLLYSKLHCQSQGCMIEHATSLARGKTSLVTRLIVPLVYKVLMNEYAISYLTL